MGASLVILVGLPVSLITRNKDDDVADERFLTPLLRRKSKILERENNGYIPVSKECNNFEMKVVYPVTDTK